VAFIIILQNFKENSVSQSNINFSNNLVQIKTSLSIIVASPSAVIETD